MYIYIYIYIYSKRVSYLLQDDHKGLLENVEVRLIDKTQGSDRTKQEYYWMRVFKTLYTDGLNIGR